MNAGRGPVPCGDGEKVAERAAAPVVRRVNPTGLPEGSCVVCGLGPTTGPHNPGALVALGYSTAVRGFRWVHRRCA